VQNKQTILLPRIIIKNPPRGPGENTPVVCRVTLDSYQLRSDQPQTRMPGLSGSRGLRLPLFSVTYCSLISIFSLFLVFHYDFIIYTDFTPSYIAASNAATDDVTN